MLDAIVRVESSYDPFAMRYEAHVPPFEHESFAKRNRITAETELTLQRFSFGLVQILGSTARYAGFLGPLSQLCIPTDNLLIGCKYLSMLRNRYPLLQDAIAAYNAGSPVKVITGGYRNQAYVDKVMKFYLEK